MTAATLYRVYLLGSDGTRAYLAPPGGRYVWGGLRDAARFAGRAAALAAAEAREAQIRSYRLAAGEAGPDVLLCVVPVTGGAAVGR